MPNKRIDQLPASTNSLKGTDKIPVFSDDRTERFTIDDVASYIDAGNDTFVSGSTYSNGTLTIGRNDGVDLTVNGFLTGTTTDTFISGSTYSNGTLTIGRNDGVDLTVSGFTTSSTLTTSVDIVAADFEGNLRTGNGVELIPDVGVANWIDIKNLTYKYKGNTTPYGGLDTNNLFHIVGGGAKYQIYTIRNVFLEISNQVWKQFPQTREDISFLAFDPNATGYVVTDNGLYAQLSRENLVGGDGVLTIEIEYEIKPTGF